MISDHYSFRGGLTGKVSLQSQYFGASPGLASGMSATYLTRRKYRAGYGIFTFSSMYHFYFCLLANHPDHPFIVVQIIQFISSIAQVLPLVTQEALISFNYDY